jgi:hypothetical protein
MELFLKLWVDVCRSKVVWTESRQRSIFYGLHSAADFKKLSHIKFKNNSYF